MSQHLLLFLFLPPSLSLFICLSLSSSTLPCVVKAMAGTRPVKFHINTVTFRPQLLFHHSSKHSPGLPVISKPLFGEASLSEQWGSIQCISIGRLWFLFVLHLLCLAMVHRNDSRVHCINSQTTWFLSEFGGEIQSVNVEYMSRFSFCFLLLLLLHNILDVQLRVEQDFLEGILKQTIKHAFICSFEDNL